MTATAMTILCLLLLVLLFAISLSGYSLTGFSRTRLDEVSEKSGQGARFLEILRGWERASIGLEVLRLSSVVGVLLTGVIAWDLMPDSSESMTSDEIFNTVMKWLALIAGLAATGIVLPRAYARTTGEIFLIKWWLVIQWATAISKPLTKIALWVDKVLHRLYDLDEPNPNDPDQLAEEIRTIADAGERTGALDAHASLMIDQVMDLKDADVASVMTPRTEMSHIKSDLSIEKARKEILEVGHTRMPVIGKSTDDIVGILYAKDLLRYTGESAGKPTSLPEICRKPFFVPETTRVDRLLQTMKRERVHLAIVLDEYGGVAGLVTMEDLLEEIVGEIDDEYDDTEPDPIKRLSPTINELDARVHIDDLVEEFDYDLPEDRDRDYDTIGGFVVSHLGRIPKQDESFTWNDLKVTVLRSDERRVQRIRIEHDDTAAHRNVDE